MGPAHCEVELRPVGDRRWQFHIHPGADISTGAERRPSGGADMGFGGSGGAGTES